MEEQEIRLEERIIGRGQGRRISLFRPYANGAIPLESPESPLPREIEYHEPRSSRLERSRISRRSIGSGYR